MELPEGLSDKVHQLFKNIRSMMLINLAKSDRNPVEILPGLYIGSIASTIFSEKLKELGITHAISALKGIKMPHVLQVSL